jgi:hypothetical protein
MSFVSALEMERRQIPAQASATIAVERSDAGSPTSPTSYRIKIASGSLSNPFFYRDLALPPVESALTAVAKEFNGYKTTQYNALASPADAPNTVYAVALQSLAESGFKHVGMGNWKYIGPYQTGYFSGSPIGKGSFLVGVPTDAGSLAQVGSGTYSGFSQAGAEADYRVFDGITEYDRFDQITTSVQVTFDQASRTVTVRLTGLQYWTRSWMTLPPLSDYYHSSDMPQSVGCSAVVPADANSFSCSVRGDQEGTFKGKFFGPSGNEVAGTFALTGLFLYGFGEAVVGAFAAKRD